MNIIDDHSRMRPWSQTVVAVFAVAGEQLIRLASGHRVLTSHVGDRPTLDEECCHQTIGQAIARTHPQRSPRCLATSGTAPSL